MGVLPSPLLRQDMDYRLVRVGIQRDIERTVCGDIQFIRRLERRTLGGRQYV